MTFSKKKPKSRHLLYKSRWFLSYCQGSFKLATPKWSPRIMNTPGCSTPHHLYLWEMNTCYVSLERYTGAACLNAACVTLPYIGQVSNMCLKKIKSHSTYTYMILITLRCLCELLLQKEKVWVPISEISNFSAAP